MSFEAYLGLIVFLMMIVIWVAMLEHRINKLEKQIDDDALWVGRLVRELHAKVNGQKIALRGALTKVRGRVYRAEVELLHHAKQLYGDGVTGEQDAIPIDRNSNTDGVPEH